MKTSKSPEKTEVTPSKKKLKQARLPFKLISEVPVSPVTPQTRKRKLSAAEAESVPKVGKICKENDLVEDVVTISDDESSLKTDTAKEEKPVNPFVKLVDTAWKKKVQKSRKKRTGKKKKTSLSESPAVATDKNINDSKDEVESMDVDLPPESDVSTICNGASEPEPKEVKESSKPSRPTRKSPRTSKSSPKALKPLSKTISKDITPDIVVLEDSNQSADASEVKAKTADVQFIDVSEVKAKTVSDVTDVNKTTEASSTEVIDKKESNSTEEINMETSKSSEKDEDEVKAVDDTNFLKKDSGSETSKQESPSKETIEKSPVTPKRSTRNIVKTDEKSTNQSNNKLEDSISSTPATPKHNRSLSVTTSLDDSLNESTLSASNLTPKQLQKRLESTKKREEREKEKQEREKKKLQEKEERAKQRQEKEEQKKKEREEKEEAKRREKEEKEEQKRKEKEEKDRLRELEKKQKEEKEEQKKKEREEKEEQRRKEKEAREEERRKKQEALELEKQEQELKKKKAAEAFVNFFVPKQKSEKDQLMSGPISNNSVLSSFTIKNDMRLAPTVRVDLTEEKRQKLDDLMEEQNAAESALYVKSLKEGSAKPLSSGKTWPLSEKDDDVMIIEDELPPIDSGGEIITCDPAVREKLRPKLLSFHDNRRPPYWGTWRKKSTAIKPRNPFGQDAKQLEYEVDSDEEWEEEQEGESIDGSAVGSDDDLDNDDYEVDNEVFVPHGYLSDEAHQVESLTSQIKIRITVDFQTNEEATMDDDDVMSLSPETQKARLKHLEDEFESEMKKPTEKLKPRLYGIIWETEDGGKPEQCVDALWNYFKKLSMIMNDPTSLLQPLNEPEESDKKKVKKKKVTSEGDKQSPKSDKKKKIKAENKETKPKSDLKKNTPEVKKNQPGINSFLTKMKNV